jgi:acyl carrier protein
MTTEAEVIAILARQSGVAPAAIGPETTIEALGLDSLGLVETIFAIEERFGISIPVAPAGDERDFDLSTVAGIVAGVAALRARPAAA